jgi:hypothetical protein
MAYFKKPKVIWSIAAGIIAILIIILCLTNPQSIAHISNPQNISQNEITEYNAETLYKYKSKYIGDASNISQLSSKLHYAQLENPCRFRQIGRHTAYFKLQPITRKFCKGAKTNLCVKNACVISAL